VLDNVDHATDIVDDDKMKLLRHLGITPTGADRSGNLSIPGWALDSELTPARKRAIVYSDNDVVRPATHGKRESSSYTYRKFEDRLQRQSSSASSGSIGIPGIFNFSASHSFSQAAETKTLTQDVFFQKSVFFEKGRIDLDRSKITLSQDFVSAVAAAVVDPQAPAARLLNVLSDYGHFAAMSATIGGRITAAAQKTLSDLTQIKSEMTKFELAASGTLSVEGVPVEGQAQTGGSSGNSSRTTEAMNSFTMNIDILGGNESLHGRGMHQKWAQSVGPFGTWKVIGFDNGSMTPLIDFLEPNLKDACYTVLRNYFRQRLAGCGKTPCPTR
jgi:hypothetical protein